MNPADLTTLDAAATLAAMEEQVRARRSGEVAEMRMVGHWCSLHTVDPQSLPGAVPPSRGGDRLLRIGGEGTPEVSELCFAELAIARFAGAVSTENYAASVLDLTHRLPLLWAAVQRLQVEAWVALKIAKDSRRLAKDKVAKVDAAVAAAVQESPARLLAIAEAKIIEADPEQHRALVEADAQRTGVWLSKRRQGDTIDEVTGEPATLRVSAKLSGGSAIRCDENIDDLARAIFDHTEPDDDGHRPTHAECRVAAFEMLTTDPHQAVAFLDELDAGPVEEESPAPSAPPAPSASPKRPRRPAKIVVHVTDRVLCGQVPGVAQVEGVGPIVLDQLSELVDGREVLVQPVIDLGETKSVNGYEHPTAVKERTLLRTRGDVFPHSTSRGLQRLDHDHATPYVSGGPPGQTGDHNDAPLTRKHHRAKTHQGYQVHQLALGAYRWVTPHGLARLVTASGTRKVELLRSAEGRVIGEIYLGTGLDYRPRT
ncbi:hypothetical protein [Nocardioides stalactiti]|uniref:hypothetical protein n=1 Tax=Nocardioides stalactiti TaxID=2755356 RepID=UPI0016008814|nr:hypothetical protein [Nocardioides stalactiti]